MKRGFQKRESKINRNLIRNERHCIADRWIRTSKIENWVIYLYGKLPRLWLISAANWTDKHSYWIWSCTVAITRSLRTAMASPSTYFSPEEIFHLHCIQIGNQEPTQTMRDHIFGTCCFYMNLFMRSGAIYSNEKYFFLLMFCLITVNNETNRVKFSAEHSMSMSSAVNEIRFSCHMAHASCTH